MPDAAKGVDEFCQMIDDLCLPARNEAEAQVWNLSITRIGCVDPHTQNGDWNPPGSAVLLYLERRDLLDLFIRLRTGREVTFFTHTMCGLKYARGYCTVEAQKGLVREFSEYVHALARVHGCNVRIVVEDVGSALPYMQDLVAAD